MNGIVHNAGDGIEGVCDDFLHPEYSFTKYALWTKAAVFVVCIGYFDLKFFSLVIYMVLTVEPMEGVFREAGQLPINETDTKHHLF